MRLTIGLSPCPNDTFIFFALLNGKIHSDNLDFQPIIKDVEELNQLALKGIPDITKVSYHTAGLVVKQYCLLRTGGALGRGCGPIIVTTEGRTYEEIRYAPIAVPGRYTTAYLLLCLYDKGLAEKAVFMPFDRIMEAVKDGKVGSGLIIHEGRFTYHRYKLKMLVDLGSWWEEETGLPIPLGGIIAKRALGENRLQEIEKMIKASIEYAGKHPEDLMPFIKSYAQEMEDDVIKQHIKLYVNQFSTDIGVEGIRAIEELLSRADINGIIPKSNKKITCL